MGFLNPNLEALEATARELEPILEELVFVGGTISGLLIDDPGAETVRPTQDVAVIAEIAGNQGYFLATQAMGSLGFQPDSRRLPKVKSFSSSIFGTIVPRRMKQVNRV